MIDIENMRLTVVKGLKKYLKCPVIRSNQAAEAPPYPYLSYTVTTLMSANNGTYGEYDDNKARKPVTSIWSITAQSDDNIESVTLANKAKEWLDYVGTVFLNDNDVIVQSTTSVSNRDNVLTSEYEYKNGFDVVFWGFDVIEMPKDAELIEAISMDEDWNQRLESRLDGTNRLALTGIRTLTNEEEALNYEFARRLSGVE